MMTPEKGRELWGQLHLMATFSMVAQQQLFPAWLDRVKSNLGCISCGWKLDHFLKLWPVEYGQGFYLWSICLHDYVNKELGRPFFYPTITVAQLLRRGIIQ